MKHAVTEAALAERHRLHHRVGIAVFGPSPSFAPKTPVIASGKARIQEICVALPVHDRKGLKEIFGAAL